MAIVKMFSIFDVKASSFSPPLCFHTVGLAVRYFGDECQRSDSMIARHPQDYDLREVGTFDTDSGGISSTVPKSVTKGSDHVVKKS